MIIDKDLMVNALDYATDHLAMPKETCEMYELWTTLENRPIVLALTKAEAAVVLTALQSDCGYYAESEEVEIYDTWMEALENALVPA